MEVTGSYCLSAEQNIQMEDVILPAMTVSSRLRMRLNVRHLRHLDVNDKEDPFSNEPLDGSARERPTRPRQPEPCYPKTHLPPFIGTDDIFAVEV